MLGGLRLSYREQEVTGVNTNRLQALLAYLALRPGVLQSREHLAFLFWPDSTEAQARTNLRQLLHHLRTALPDGGQFLSADSQNILWRSTAEFSIDVAEFEKAAAKAEKAAKAGDLAESRKELERAAALYGGDFMPGLYDEWAEDERKRLRTKCSDVLQQFTALLETTGDLSSAVQCAERLLSLDPFCETTYQKLMRLHALKGDRATALLVYHQCVTVLRRELDTDPGAATRKLRDELTKTEIAPEQPKLSNRSGATHLALTGRQREFERLLELWKIAEQGRASFVLVTGESGIGKTRLLEELLTWAARRGAATAFARCYSAEGRLAYAPVADWIRSPALRPLCSSLHASQLCELARVLPELLIEHPQLGVPPPLSESWQRHHFFEALARAILASPHPLLLLVDDLQWCDQETLDWLHYLLRLESKAQLLIAGTARIEDLNDRHPLRSLMRAMSREGSSTEIPLGSLSSKDTAFLAAQVSDKQLEAEFMARLYDETAGNPLFVIESVRARMLSKDRPFDQTDSDESHRTIPLPPKVHAVLSSRLAQLSPNAQDLASLAACIGRTFTASLLGKASRCDEDTLVSLLDELWQRRIIRVQDGESYDFSHDKLREVAYAELSPARRQLYHRRIAEAIAELSGSDTGSVCAELARHYELAALPARAVPLYHEAANISRQRYAETEAIACLTRALQLLESLPQGEDRDRTELNLLLPLGISLSATEGYAAPKVGRVYAKARMLCESNVGDKDHYFKVLWGSWVFHVVKADLQVAREMASRLLQIAGDIGDTVMTAAANFAVGCTQFHLGEMTECRKHFEEAMAGNDSSDKPVYLTVFGPELGVFCLSYMAQILWMFGDREQSLDFNRRALARAERLAHPFSIALALDYASMLHQLRGEASEAAGRAAESAILCRQYGFSYYLAWASIIRGWALAETGSASEAIAEIQDGLTSLREQGAALRGPYYQTLLAQAFGRSGDVDKALDCLSQALVIREKSGECWADPLIYQFRGTLLRQKGDTRGADSNQERALSLAARQKRR